MATIILNCQVAGLPSSKCQHDVNVVLHVVVHYRSTTVIIAAPPAEESDKSPNNLERQTVRDVVVLADESLRHDG